MLKQSKPKKLSSLLLLALLVSMLVIPLSIPPTQAQEADIFRDDFESYAVGTFPSAGGWMLSSGRIKCYYDEVRVFAIQPQEYHLRVNKALLISQKAADYVISKAVAEGNGLKWPFQSTYVHYNPIFQNGAAGVGYFLITLYKVTKNTTYLHYAEKAANWIISQAKERDGGLTWSHYDDERPRKFTDGWYLTPEKSVSGVGRFFLELYKATGKYEYLNYAEGAARWIINVGLVKTKHGSYVDYNPYHQAAFGVYSYPQRDVGLLLLDLYEVTGNVAYMNKAKEIGEWILWTSECEDNICKWYDDRGYGNVYSIEGVSPLIDFLYRLYKETGNVSYLVTAEKMVNWVGTRGVKVGSGMKFPDLKGRCRTIIWGDWDRLLSVMTPADVFLWSYKVTGNQSRLSVAKAYADWLISISVKDGDGLKVPMAEGDATYHAWINARIYRFVMELYSLTRDIRYMDYAEKLLNWIIYSAVDKNGYVWPYYDGREFPTFYYGSSGIGYYVLTGLQSETFEIPPTGRVTLGFEPSRGSVAQGGTYEVKVVVSEVSKLDTALFTLSFNPSVLRFLEVRAGDLMPRAEVAFNVISDGKVRILISQPLGAPGVTGSGSIAVVKFSAIGGRGSSTEISFLDVSMADSDANPIEVTTTSGFVTIGPGVLPGDMNKNGILDTGDATIVLRKVVGLEPTLPEDISIGDMNGNGILDTGDATIILRKVVGLE